MTLRHKCRDLTGLIRRHFDVIRYDCLEGPQSTIDSHDTLHIEAFEVRTVVERRDLPEKLCVFILECVERCCIAAGVRAICAGIGELE